MSGIFFLEIILVGIFLGLLVAMIILLVLQVRTTRQVNKLTFPAYEYVVRQAEHDAETIVSDARKNALDIITKAELTGHEVIQEHTTMAEKMSAEFRVEMSKQVEAMTHSFQDVANTESGLFKEALIEMKSEVEEQKGQMLKSIGEANQSMVHLMGKAKHESSNSLVEISGKIEDLGSGMVKHLQTIREQIEQDSSSFFKNLKDEVRVQAEEYEQSRKKIIDIHIEQIVEQIVRQVLHVQLPVEQHGDLVRKALEEAKSRKVL
jgi:phage-related protein